MKAQRAGLQGDVLLAARGDRSCLIFLTHEDRLLPLQLGDVHGSPLVTTARVRFSVFQLYCLTVHHQGAISSA